MRSLFVGLLIATIGTAGPSDDQVQEARKALAPDPRVGASAAIDTLAQEGSPASLSTIADYGARTRYLAQTRAAGAALAKTPVAATELRRVLSAHKRDPAGRARVAIMASQLPAEQALAILQSLAKDRQTTVAARAVRALGTLGDSRSRPLLLRLLKAKDKEVAAAAAMALVDLPADQATMKSLFERVQHSDARVGGACAVALSRMEGAAPFGNRALSLLSKHTQRESFHALAKLTLWLTAEPDAKAVRRALGSKSPAVREIACELIGTRRLAGYQEELVRLTTANLGRTDEDWRVQVSAWLALRRVGIDEVRSDIERRIRREGEPSYWAIQCAARWPNEELIGALREAALDGDDALRRELAQIALRKARFCADATRDFYLGIWRRQRGTTKGQAALLGLGNLRDLASFDALVTLLEAESKEKYRLWTLKSLEKLTGHYYKPDPQVWKDFRELVKGEVAFEPEPIDRKKNRARVAKIKELGISAETENAVEEGLSWLARHQGASGGWSGVTYHGHCLGEGCRALGGLEHCGAGYAGLALLAFQGAGYTQEDGPYRDEVLRGFDYLEAQACYDASHDDDVDAGTYQAAIVCQALADGYTLTGDVRLGAAAQRRVDYLAKIQRPGGAWRYEARSSETDTSVLSWVLMASVSARHAGLEVPGQIEAAAALWLDTVSEAVPPREYEILVPDHFRAGNRYFQDVSRGERGKIRDFRIKTWYRPPFYSAAMPAAGLLCRVWMGWTRAHPYCVGSANQLLSHTPGYARGLELKYPHYPYTWYYGSLAMYQMGGRYWSRWRESCLADVLRHQQREGCLAGAWTMPSTQYDIPRAGGTICSTAMAVLALESFYRYQPYLTRSREPK